MRPGAPFKRANAIFALVSAALAIQAPLARAQALRDIGPYKSRGKGRGAPLRRHGLQGSWPKAHQSGQECLRRAVGGWGFRSRYTGMTKRETLQFLAPHSRIPLERAIQIVRGLSPLREAA